MKEIKAPGKYEASTFCVFLAGSIEMGSAELWQDKVRDALVDTDCMLLNPRRDDWDASWKQDINDTQFFTQVSWELTGILEKSHLVCFYFDKNSKSPITLLELGLALSSRKEVIVCCPKGFWRKGNIDITCNKFGIPVLESLSELINCIIEKRKHHVHH